jgi:hypothetical protein
MCRYTVVPPTRLPRHERFLRIGLRDALAAIDRGNDEDVCGHR